MSKVTDMISEEGLQKDHWFKVGERAAENVMISCSKKSAEQCANIKGLFGTPKMQFIAGFKLRMLGEK